MGGGGGRGGGEGVYMPDKLSRATKTGRGRYVQTNSRWAMTIAIILF